MKRIVLLVVALCGITLAGTGCSTARGVYYNAWEKAGYSKRERLVDDVKAARQEQVKAKQQFASALDEFKSVTHFQGGDLEALYNKINAQYEACDSRAGAVRSKIQSVKNVGTKLFEEWTGEIAQIKDDPGMRQQSQQLYDKTHRSYDQLVMRMDAAAATMDPVLVKFKNRVLFIKANLNAQAIASLKGTELDLGGDIDKLIKEMEASIAEADAFIAQTHTEK
ncbi:MAG: hypothetical protein JWL69_5109 [Phycisphaerales bacterium]|nr:hypothetical protein [Phycisphaerales bacterium]